VGWWAPHAHRTSEREREFFIDTLLVRIHVIIEMIWWTGLAPWEFQFPFSGSRISTFLAEKANSLNKAVWVRDSDEEQAPATRKGRSKNKTAPPSPSSAYSSSASSSSSFPSSSSSLTEGSKGSKPTENGSNPNPRRNLNPEADELPASSPGEGAASRGPRGEKGLDSVDTGVPRS